MEGGSDLLPIVLFTGVGIDGGHPWPAPGEWWPIPGPGFDFRKMLQLMWPSLARAWTLASNVEELIY